MGGGQDDFFEGTAAGSDRDVIYVLRTIHQNQTQLVALADQKANILIGIVAVIFTILFTNAGFLSTMRGWLLVPFAMFLCVEVAAAALSLIVIVPRNTKRRRLQRLEDASNPLFFGSFLGFEQSEFLTHVTDKLDGDRAARQLLLADIYQMGVVLRKKYDLLRFAYIFAAIGFVLLLSLIVTFALVN